MRKWLRRPLLDQVGRKLVQLGFLALFLYPLLVVVYKRATFQPAPTLTSWLLPFDPLLMAGQAASWNTALIVIGAPLMLLALSFVLASCAPAATPVKEAPQGSATEVSQPAAQAETITVIFPKHEADLIALARIHENIASPQLAARLYASGIKGGLPVDLELTAVMRYAEFCKHNGHSEEAILLWEKAVKMGCLDACIELAKYHEHQSCDLALAYQFTETAISLLPDSQLFSIRKQRSEIIHRQNRLMKKINKNSTNNPGETNGK